MYGTKKRLYKRRPIRRSVKPKAMVKKAVRGARTRMFNKKVLSVINRQAETKIANFYQNGLPVINVNSLDWNLSIKNIMPQQAGGLATTTMFNIPQNDTQAGRTGNEIAVKRILLSGVVRLNNQFNETTNYNPCPIRVCLWIVKLKPHIGDTTSDLETQVKTHFYEFGSSDLGMTGTNMDLVRYVNKSRITLVKKRVFLLGNATYPSAFNVGSANNANQVFSNNDSSQSRMFRFTLSAKDLPSKLKFSDATNLSYVDTPLNTRKLYMFWTCHRVDGGIPLTSTNSQTGPIPAFVDMSAQFEYTDI